MTASLICDSNLGTSVKIASVSSDEPDNGGSDGNTINDIVIAVDCKSLQLRKERMGSGNGSKVLRFTEF